MKKLLLSLFTLISLFLAIQGLAFAQNSSFTKLGCIEKVFTSKGKNYVKVDYIEMLGIEQAKSRKGVLEAAAKDGILEKDDNGELYFLNDYYIYNPSKKLHTIALSKEAELLLCDFQSQNVASTFKSISPSSLKKFVNNEGPLLGHITIKNNKIIKVVQQYTP